MLLKQGLSSEKNKYASNPVKIEDYLTPPNKVAKNVQERVKRWMNYTWSTHKTFNENKILEFLPLKMRTDIAMRVHYSTLGKVKLFRNCEPGLLQDLVVVLRPIIYLPGDYICRKDDIGKEMFILNELFSLKKVIICINKMDDESVDYSQNRF